MIPTRLLFFSSIQTSIRSIQNEWRELEGCRLQWISESTQRRIQDVGLKIIENASCIAFITSVALTFTVSPWFLLATPLVAVIGVSSRIIREYVFGSSSSINFLDYYKRELNRKQAAGKSLKRKVKYIHCGLKKRMNFLISVGKMSQEEKRDRANRQKPFIRTLKLIAYILSSLDSIHHERQEECMNFIRKSKNYLNDLNLELPARDAFLHLLNKIEENPVRAKHLFEEIKRVNRARPYEINTLNILAELATTG